METTDDLFFEDFESLQDVTGDDYMVLLLIPGRKKGSIRMLTRQLGWAPILLVRYLIRDASLLEQAIVPGTGDKQALLASFRMVRRLKSRLPGLRIVPSQDFCARDAIARATRRAA